MISGIKRLKQSELSWVLMGGLVVLALGTLFLQGCSQSPVDSGENQSIDAIAALEAIEQVVDPSGPSAVRGTREVERVYTPTIVDSDCTEGTFDSTGGTMVANIDNEEVRFVIPAGALTESVFIKICGFKGVNEIGQVNYVYDCFPSGQQFAQPMVLFQPWPTSSVARMFFKGDEPFAPWTFEATAAASNNIVQFNIHHFSKYGISN